METKYKTAKVIKPYSVKYRGWDLTVPVGATVSNKTACGNDDSFRFWENWRGQVKELTGYADSMLAHDLTHYGLNVPADHCEPYAKPGTTSATDKLANMEFKIAFSETNLRYLAGEPDSEEKRRNVATNVAGIAEAKAEIERLKGGAL